MQPIAYRVLFAEVGILLLLATGNLPFAFYAFLRGAVAIAGGVMIFRGWTSGKKAWVIPGATAIVLFGAVFGFEFPKATWMPIDFLAAIVFFAAAAVLGAPQRVINNDPDATDVTKLEDNSQNVGAVIAVVTGILFLFYLMVGTGGDPSACPNWVEDGRGGYCEG